ncbi:MAG: S1C family serine protease, partial [Alphaproteobacteria bacterium]|nr:S1C family serine protease [Alphaproteobacteria bacterium]
MMKPYYHCLFFFVFCLLAIPSTTFAELDKTITLQAKKGVVSISKRTNLSAYEYLGQTSGSGFIIDREQGLIVTNHHVVGHASISTYEVGFFNGTEVPAQLLYFDSWQDFAFLKVDPSKIPEGTPTLKTSKVQPALGESVFIVGKNAGQNYSLQSGELSSHYDSLGHLPNQSYRISLNTRGGASGSPVLNTKGEVIGIIHSSNYDNFGFALPASYFMDAYQELKNGKKPTRRSPGFLVSYYSLDRAAKFYKFPSALIENYIKTYPNSFNRILMIGSVFKDSPAMGKLEVGDIIWKVNGKAIGPNLYEMDKIFDTTHEKTIKITVYRQGMEIDIEVSLEDLQKNDVTRMVQFGGATFFEANDYLRYFTNVSKKAVFVTNIKEGSSFAGRIMPIPGVNYVMLNVVGFSGQAVQSLDDLIKIIPDLVASKDFNMLYKNYGTLVAYDNIPLFSHGVSTQEVSFEEIDGPPMLYTFDSQNLTWQATPLITS